MCHSHASRNPGNREFYSFLDSRFRGNDTASPGLVRRPASPAKGEAICFIQLTCYPVGFFQRSHLPFMILCREFL